MADSNVNLEGSLLKWTNYFSGWQQRWFRLTNANQLEYYLSHDEVGKGCRGSVKVSVCDVLTYQHDPLRFDLIITGEQHWCLRATNQIDKQNWIVAIGSCKACLVNGQPYSKALVKSEAQIRVDELSVRQSELRLYHSLLQQQLRTVQSQLAEDKVPEMGELNEVTAMLNATVDTFTRTLDACVALATTEPAEKPRRRSHRSVATAVAAATPSSQSGLESPVALVTQAAAPNFSGFVANPGEEWLLTPLMTDLPAPAAATSAADADSISLAGDNNRPIHQRQPAFKRSVNNFFSLLPTSFEDIRLGQDNAVPVLPFLEACGGMLALVDIFNSTAFMPVRSDIQGNIAKIKAKHSVLNQQVEHTLQALVEAEVRLGHSSDLNSASVALLWLKRSMQFLQLFVKQMCSQQGGDELQEVANYAYANSLKPYHGWVVRGVFALVAKSLPARQDLMRRLMQAEPDAEGDAQLALAEDASHYAKAMERLINVIDELMVRHRLDSKQQV